MTTQTSPTYQAAQYEQFRPNYPTAIAQHVLNSVNTLTPDSTLLEIGCGTGKGTEPFIKLGCKVHAVEPLADMAKVAANKFPNRFSYQLGTFEECVNSLSSYPLIFSAQAFHWVDQELAFNSFKRLIEPGGALALFRNNWKYDTAFSTAEHHIKADLFGYRRHVSWNAEHYDAIAEMITHYKKLGAGIFHKPEVYEFDHEVTYTTESYLGLQKTFFSDKSEYDAKTWSIYRTRIADFIESLGGKFEVTYTAILFVLRRLES